MIRVLQKKSDFFIGNGNDSIVIDNENSPIKTQIQRQGWPKTNSICLVQIKSFRI